jgi:hypothetical protein
VNALLLVTAAWLSVADTPQGGKASPPAAPSAPAASAPAIAAPIVSTPGPSCGGGCVNNDCGCGCDSCCKVSFLDRLKAKFHHDCCDSGCGCGSSCGCGCEAPKHCHRCEAPKPCCCEAPKHCCEAPRPCCTKCETCCDTCGCKESLFSRLFHKKNCCDTCSTCGCGGCGSVITATPAAVPALAPAAPSGEKIGKPKEDNAKPMPEKKTMLMPPAIELAPASSKITETETQHPFELCHRYDARVKRATDYSWITGQLFYVHADGGLWVVRYSPVGQEDQNGGGVILARTLDMDSYREGDLVTVRGEILNEKGSRYLGAPLYRVNEIQLVDRVQ